TTAPHHSSPPPSPTRRSSDLFIKQHLAHLLGRAQVELAARQRVNVVFQPRHGLGKLAGQAREHRAVHFHAVIFHAHQNFGHPPRSEEHTSELQSRENLVCRLL